MLSEAAKFELEVTGMYGSKVWKVYEGDKSIYRGECYNTAVKVFTEATYRSDLVRLEFDYGRAFARR